MTCCFLWRTSVSHLHVLINILIISFKLLKIKPVPFQTKIGTIIFRWYYLFYKVFCKCFFTSIISQILMIVKRNFFFRIHRIHTNKRRNEKSLHIAKGKIIFVFTVFTFSMNLSEKWNTIRVIWTNLLHSVIILKEFKCISPNDCSCINVIHFLIDFRWSRADCMQSY